MLAKAVRERIRPVASIAPAVVVPVPTPKPPLTNTELVAVMLPKYGEEEALKVCSVPAEVIAKGPLAVKVCVLPVNPPREVMPVPLVAPIQVPLGKQTFPVPLS